MSHVTATEDDEMRPEELPEPPRLRDFTKLPLLIIAGMFIAAAVIYPAMPERFPTHWGITGAPDAWSSKSFFSVFFMPMLTLGVYGLLVAVPYLDPRRRSLKLTFHAYNVIIDAVTALQALIFAATLVAAFDTGFDVAKVVLVGVGALFAVVGNFMTTVKQNWTFGVRVSWTLADEVVWRKANRLGGYLFAAAGVITALSAFFPPPVSFAVMFSTILLVLVVTYVYAFLVYRSRHPEA